MGFFFLLAGYFTPAALERKGYARFIGDRFLRLGLPLLAFGLVLGPLTAALVTLAQGDGFWPTLRLSLAAQAVHQWSAMVRAGVVDLQSRLLRLAERFRFSTGPVSAHASTGSGFSVVARECTGNRRRHTCDSPVRSRGREHLRTAAWATSPDTSSSSRWGSLPGNTTGCAS